VAAQERRVRRMKEIKIMETISETNIPFLRSKANLLMRYLSIILLPIEREEND
jgi:hypothetical protein